MIPAEREAKQQSCSYYYNEYIYIKRGYYGRIMEKASHSFEYVLTGRNNGILGRTILHCIELLRHLVSWPQGSKKPVAPPSLCTHTFPNTLWKRSLPFLRTALLEGPSLLRNNLVLLIRMTSCLWEYSRMRYIRLGGRENRKEVFIQSNLNPFLMNPSTKFPGLLFRAQVKR